MSQATVSSQSVTREILHSTEWTRDALPYTDDFDKLYNGYVSQTGEKLTKHKFWRMLSNAAKRGGWKGKRRGEPAPDLTLQQCDVLRALAAGKLGSRDSLAYTTDLDEIRRQFNEATRLSLTERQVWRSLCNLGKKSHKPDVEALLVQAVDSLILGIEHFNRPSERGRAASVLIMLDHATESLLKAALLERGGDIRNPKTGFAHSIEFCLNKGTDDAQVKFLSDDERRTFQVLNALRDQAQHYLVDVSEQILYTVAQGTVTLFAELFARLFGHNLCDQLPKRVLPISVNPPRDVQVLMDDEYTQLKELLKGGTSDQTASEPRVRSLLAIDRALNRQASQVSDEELTAVTEAVQKTDNWEDVFKGIAQIKLTTDGAGVDVAIYLTKRDGIPVRVAADGEDPQAVVAIRKINDTDFYCYSTKALAKKLGLTVPKTGALIKYLDLQSNAEYFKIITIDRSQFKRYSGNALAKLKRALPDVDMDDVWRRCRPRTRKPRYGSSRAWERRKRWHGNP